MKTLIIEDEPVNAVALEMILGDKFDAQICPSGEEGLEAFKTSYKTSEPFKVLFLDLTLPNMNGREVLLQIRAYEKKHLCPEQNQLKVILVSASLESDTILGTLLEDGGDAFIMKPISSDKITKALKNLKL
jgi:two-component system, chemotaxis family, chemotaxis protein CheY